MTPTCVACYLHAHNLLLFRTAAAGELDADAAQTLACGIVYLQTRHKWNMRLLAVPETEVFELLQTQRRNLATGDARRGGGARRRGARRGLEAVVRVTAGRLRVARAATDAVGAALGGDPEDLVGGRGTRPRARSRRGRGCPHRATSGSSS